MQPIKTLPPASGITGAGAHAATANELDSGMHEAADRAAAGARPGVDRIADSAHQVVEKIAIAASDVVESLGVKAEEVQDIQARLLEQCRGHVRENPLTSVGIALAAGFVLGKLLTPH